MEKNWSERCIESIRRERAEVSARHGIRIGQTEVYCARCGRSWGFGNHTCSDIRFQRLREAQKARHPIQGRLFGENGSEGPQTAPQALAD